MKTTIDIPDKELREVMRLTRAKTKREAVVKAISEYNRRQRVEEINRMMGTLNGFITLKELLKTSGDGLIKQPTIYLIDTSAWVEAIRPAGDKAMAERIRGYNTRGQSAWCSMVRLELWNGARGHQEMAFLKYLEASIMELPINEEVWHLADQFARQARQVGKTFPSTDLLIAACARFHGAEVVHLDKHFDQLKAL